MVTYVSFLSTIGFGGKFGVQTDRKDKSALTYDEEQDKIGTNYERTRPVVPVKNAGNLRARFENMAKQKEEEDKRKAEEERKKREEKGMYCRGVGNRGAGGATAPPPFC